MPTEVAKAYIGGSLFAAGQEPVSGSLKCFWDIFRAPGVSASVSLVKFIVRVKSYCAL